jgi:hypothetical protein
VDSAPLLRTDRVVATVLALAVFLAVIAGVYVAPTAVRCHHHRGHLAFSGLHVRCEAQHVVRYVPMT